MPPLEAWSRWRPVSVSVSFPPAGIPGSEKPEARVTTGTVRMVGGPGGVLGESISSM